jgi:hypothetical protein
MWPDEDICALQENISVSWFYEATEKLKALALFDNKGRFCFLFVNQKKFSQEKTEKIFIK